MRVFSFHKLLYHWPVFMPWVENLWWSEVTFCFLNGRYETLSLWQMVYEVRVQRSLTDRWPFWPGEWKLNITTCVLNWTTECQEWFFWTSWHYDLTSVTMFIQKESLGTYRIPSIKSEKGIKSRYTDLSQWMPPLAHSRRYTGCIDGIQWINNEV